MGKPGPRDPQGWKKGVWLPTPPPNHYGLTPPTPHCSICISFSPYRSLPKPSPLTIHRPKLLHMGAGQDLLVERLGLSIFALLQVTGSLGAGRQKCRSKRWRQNLSQAQGFPLLGLFMTFPRDPPHTSLSSCRVKGVPTPLPRG